ncbi:MAG: ankyrin repeat domain-containing protein [Treponema sp.]|nr:ankyrin repeat domain-containing protein [Treponema sp.]
MTVMLFHDGGDRKTVKRLLDILEKFEKTTEECIPGDHGEGLIPVSETLARSRCIVLRLSRPTAPAWVYVLAGYSMALKVPLLAYGLSPETFGPLLSHCLVPVNTERELSEYMSREAPEFFAREVRNRARYELLEAGISLSEESLADCVIGGNKRALTLFLEAGFSPNIRDRFGVPLLNLAARQGHRNLVKILLRAGADVNGQAEDRLNTALMDAVSGRHHHMVRDMLAAGADVNLKSRDEQSALVLAVGMNDEFSAELLLRAGANADEPDLLGSSARKYAALFNKPAMVSLFKIHGPQKDAR